jgi:hypothetical protein
MSVAGTQNNNAPSSCRRFFTDESKVVVSFCVLNSRKTRYFALFVAAFAAWVQKYGYPLNRDSKPIPPMVQIVFLLFKQSRGNRMGYNLYLSPTETYEEGVDDSAKDTPRPWWKRIFGLT